jgi:hypothetical protein
MSAGRTVGGVRQGAGFGTHLNHGLANTHYALILLGIGARHHVIGNGAVHTESQYSRETYC